MGNENQDNLNSDNYSEYDQLTERDWVDVEFATIAYDYQIHPDAVGRISLLLDRLESALQGLY